MLTKPIPGWILGGGAVLAAMAGCVNAVGFLSVRHQALSHLSGTVSNLGLAVAQGDGDLAGQTLAVIGSFFMGCVLSGIVIQHSALKITPHYGVALVLESAALTMAAYLLRHGVAAGSAFAAMACGLQNAMATTYSGAVIRTTHVTGMITDLGIALGQLARREQVDRRRAGLYALLLSAFFLGGLAGALGFGQVGVNVLFFPAAAAGLSGLGYALVICPGFASRRRA